MLLLLYLLYLDMKENCIQLVRVLYVKVLYLVSLLVGYLFVIYITYSVGFIFGSILMSYGDRN